VCGARPDLLDHRPQWAGRPDPLVELEPLSREQSEQIIDGLLGRGTFPLEVRERIITAAEGNPLFVQQVLSMLIDDGLLRREESGWVPTGDLADLAIPGTIQALLAARLDLLSAPERAVIEPASVIGLVFEQLPVEELVPDAVRGEVAGHLEAMTRKQLLRPEPSESDHDYRFHHILVRDAAYQGILKRSRATLHERFADWAERINRDRDREAQFEEILGYHLEQAYQYLSELGPLDDHGTQLGRRAAARLATAGHRAFARGDMAAAANLLRRAAALFPAEDPARLRLLPDLGEAMMETGEFAWAEVFLDEALEGAAAAGDEQLRADALLTQLLVRHHATDELDEWRADVQRTTAELIPLLEQRKAYAELAKAWRMVAFVHGIACAWEETAAAQQQAIGYARLAGNTRQEARMSGAYSMALCAGPTPVPDAIERCSEMLARGLEHRQSETLVLCSLALLHAMRGEFERARELYRGARPMLEDYGAVVLAASTSLTSGYVELLAGELEAAEAELRRDHDRLVELGELYYRPLVAVLLAQTLFAQDRLDEADELAGAAAEIAAEDDIESQALWRSVKAKILARQGGTREGARLAREATELLATTDAVLARSDALIDLAEVLRAGGDGPAAFAALEEAHELCRLKQMTVQSERVEHLLDALRSASVPQQA
jgi:tetratricopeptide (TPR) repeat protein